MSIYSGIYHNHYFEISVYFVQPFQSLPVLLSVETYLKYKDEFQLS